VPKLDQTDAHLANHAVPPVPVGQWVISVPKRLRGMLADRLNSLIETASNFRWHSRRARGV